MPSLNIPTSHDFRFRASEVLLRWKQFSFCGAWLCAEHQSQRRTTQKPMVCRRRAAVGRDDTAALQAKPELLAFIEEANERKPAVIVALTKNKVHRTRAGTRWIGTRSLYSGLACGYRR